MPCPPPPSQIFKDRGVEVDFQPDLGKDKDKLAAIIGDFDGLAIRSATKVTAEDARPGATKLKVIGRAGIGVDNVDIPAATAQGIIVMNTPFGNSITTAEHAIALMLALARQIPAADASTQAGKWEKNRFMGVEITGKTLGMIGCGNIGSIVADRAIGLKMRVIAYDPFLSPERAARSRRREGRARRSARARRFHHPAYAADRRRPRTSSTPKRSPRRRRACASSIARAAGWSTRRRCAPRSIPAMSRAPPSTCSVEEPATANPLFGHPNVVCTPHLGAATTEAQENVALQVAEQMSDYLLRGAITNAVNFPSITAEEAPKLRAVHRARREARLVRRPAHRDRHQEGADRL